MFIHTTFSEVLQAFGGKSLEFITVTWSQVVVATSSPAIVRHHHGCDQPNQLAELTMQRHLPTTFIFSFDERVH